MLVLSRNPDQKIEIIASNGERIVITYVRQSAGGQIHLGFEANKFVRIIRQELIGKNPRPDGRVINGPQTTVPLSEEIDSGKPSIEAKG